MEDKEQTVVNQITEATAKVTEVLNQVPEQLRNTILDGVYHELRKRDAAKWFLNPVSVPTLQQAATN